MHPQLLIWPRRSKQHPLTSQWNILDLLLALPLSVLLPTIGFNTAYKRREGRVRRVGSEAGTEEAAPPLLQRINFLFSSLDVDDEHCKQRAICEIVQKKLMYSPLSDLLISIFR